MTTQTRLMTVEDLATLSNDGDQYELVQGELQPMPPAFDDHSTYEANIFLSLGSYVKAQKLGRVYSGDSGFVIATNPDTVLSPDVAFMRQERIEAAGHLLHAYRPGAPDFVVEVVSGGDRLTEVARKVELWLVAGVQMILVVNPRKSEVTIHQPAVESITLGLEDTLDGGSVVPGWTMPVREVFSAF